MPKSRKRRATPNPPKKMKGPQEMNMTSMVKALVEAGRTAGQFKKAGRPK